MRVDHHKWGPMLPGGGCGRSQRNATEFYDFTCTSQILGKTDADDVTVERIGFFASARVGFNDSEPLSIMPEDFETGWY